MKSILLLITIITTQSFASTEQTTLPHSCGVRLNNHLYIEIDFKSCDFSKSYNENLCTAYLTNDNGYLGGNTCERYGEDGEYGCTQVGVGRDEVVLKRKKNGVIKIKRLIGQEHGGVTGSDFGSYLYRKLLIRSKFKVINGEIYIIRDFKKRKMECYNY